MDQKPIDDIKVKTFAEQVRKHLRVERMMLFGSRARGQALKDSDYDFVIVSPDFKGIFFTRRSAEMYKYWDYPETLEALCYTPEEFEKKSGQISIVREAVTEGVLV